MQEVRARQVVEELSFAEEIIVDALRFLVSKYFVVGQSLRGFRHLIVTIHSTDISQRGKPYERV
jgi:hypothetical protein